MHGNNMTFLPDRPPIFGLLLYFQVPACIPELSLPVITGMHDINRLLTFTGLFSILQLMTLLHEPCLTCKFYE